MNPHERAARSLKVLAMLTVLARHAPEAFRQADRAAEFLATWPQANRLALAAEAGVRPPSPETWAMFVEAVRGRKEAA